MCKRDMKNNNSDEKKFSLLLSLFGFDHSHLSRESFYMTCFFFTCWLIFLTAVSSAFLVFLTFKNSLGRLSFVYFNIFFLHYIPEPFS